MGLVEWQGRQAQRDIAENVVSGDLKSSSKWPVFGGKPFWRLLGDGGLEEGETTTQKVVTDQSEVDRSIDETLEPWTQQTDSKAEVEGRLDLVSGSEHSHWKEEKERTEEEAQWEPKLQREGELVEVGKLAHKEWEGMKLNICNESEKNGESEVAESPWILSVDLVSEQRDLFVVRRTVWAFLTLT